MTRPTNLARGRAKIAGAIRWADLITVSTAAMSYQAP
jgi:hypothetical protein